MIIEVRNINHQTMSAIFDPFDILCKLSCDWRESIGVQRDSLIVGGYWMLCSGDKYKMTYIRLRLATRKEIVLFDAMKRITEYTATLSM